MAEQPEQTADPPVRIQPPNFLRPRSSQLWGQRPAIYLSWDEEVRGPATEDEILAGLRASSFGEKTLYWHEGMEEWKPVVDFSPAPMEQAPRPEGTALKSNLPPKKPKLRHHHAPALAPRHRGFRFGTHILILTFILLAALVMVGVIFLLMKFG